MFIQSNTMEIILLHRFKIKFVQNIQYFYFMAFHYSKEIVWSKIKDPKVGNLEQT